MFRIPTMLLFSVLFLFNSAFAFDEEKAKKDYRGADFKVSSINEMVYENAPAIAISFTAPLSKARLKDHYVTLKGGGSDHWIINKDRTKLIFPFVSPETKYSVRVTNEVRDVNGQRLEESKTTKLKTKRLQPTVNFSSSGHIISSSGPKTLPVTTLNIDEVNIDFFAINDTNIPELLRYMHSNGSKYYGRVNEIKNHGKLIYSGRFELKNRLNQRTECNINLDEIKKLNEPGLYAAVMYKAGEYEYDYEYAYFMQTNIGLHVRRYEKTFDIYAQDITTGHPLSGVKLSVVNRKGESLEKGISDSLGKASFNIQKNQYFVTATKKDQFSVLALNRNALDLSGLKNAVTSHSEYQIYSWGPRDLYRPAEKISVNSLVRNYDGKLPPSMPLDYTLYKPDGGKLKSGRIQPSEKGFYAYEYQTTDSSQTGRYHLKFSFADSNKSSYFFKVEDFLPERIDLQLFDGDVDKNRVIGKESLIKVPVTSNYLYGAPASGNKVDGFVTARVNPHPFKELPTVHFGDMKENINYNRRTFYEIKLSDDGTGELSMQNRWLENKSPIALGISASVYETGGRPVTRRSALTVLNGSEYIGIEPQFKGNPDSNTTIDIKVGCVGRDGKWLKNKPLQVTLIRQDRNWFWRHTDSRGWHWAWNDKPVTVFSKSVMVGESGTETVSLPVSWGNYRVEVINDKTESAFEFKTSWSWWGNARDESSQKPDQVSLGFDKSSYKPGDPAKLRIDPPQDGLALITVESSKGVLFTQYMPVKSSGTLIDIQTDKNWDRHDLYASVMVIRPGDMTKTPVPTRAFGMVHMPLKRDNTLLNVTIDAPEKVEPNSKIKAKIKVTADYPVPSNTKVVVALVDVGILNITRFKTPDAETYFFGPRRYNIELYDNYGQVIDNIGPKDARQRFGGGFSESDDDLARGGDKPKSDVMMVSFFSKPLAIDENGETEVDFDLPSFNGKLRWMVMVYADEQFGKTDADTLVADKVVTQLSMPRFLAMGDKSTIALDIQNMSDADQTLNLLLTLNGSLKELSEEKSLTLKDKAKTTLRFPITPSAATGQGVISIQVVNEDKSIKVDRTWRIGVRSPYPTLSRNTFAVINPESDWKPDIKTDDLIPESVAFQMTISDKPPIDFAGHFQYLLHYPYGCLEQSTSSSYPWVLATPAMLSKLNLTGQVKKQFNRDYDDTFRKEQIQKGIERVLDRQKSNGSFGLWGPHSPESKWLSVYATEFLNDAKKTGVSVNSDALKKANNRLRKYLSGNYNADSRHYSEDISHYEFAFRSYAGYVLAKTGIADLRDLRRLSDKFTGKTDDDGLSWQYLAVAFKLTGDAKNAGICYNQSMKERERVRHRYYGEYGSNVRDLARMTELVYEYDFDKTGQLLFDLSAAVKDRRWLSTQERIALFKTAVFLEDGSGKNWTATLATKKTDQKLDRNRTFNTLFDLDMYKGFKGVKAGDKTLYTAVSMVGLSENIPEPQSNGLSITRKFYDTDGKLLMLDQMKSGELAVVQLVITADKRTPDGLVVDLLPAGVEIENQNLGLASVKLDDIKIDGKPVSKHMLKNNIKHQEFRDDRYVAAVDIKKYGSTTLFYLIRAVTPGIYKMPCSYVEDMYRPYRFAIGKTNESIEVFE